MSRGRPPTSLAALRRRLAAARSGGPGGAAARQLIALWLDTAESHAMPVAEALRKLRSGAAGLQMAGLRLEAQAADPAGPAARAACSAGCAFCCILAGRDGAVITEAEARALHAALAPQASAPDGRLWHPRACPALDPATRTCRAYAARPMICRTYLSDDPEACREVSEGRPRPGPGVLGAQSLHLEIHHQLRELLRGITAVPTYALAAIAEAAMAGRDVEAALAEARHTPRVLAEERRRLSGAPAGAG
ncbi:YkgJ family cysteine cluster protein [Roseivivax sp. CAU 1761]